jgi:hypothetical protein
MLSITLTRHPVSTLTPAPAVPALKRSAPEGIRRGLPESSAATALLEFPTAATRARIILPDTAHANLGGIFKGIGTSMFTRTHIRLPHNPLNPLILGFDEVGRPRRRSRTLLGSFPTLAKLERPAGAPLVIGEHKPRPTALDAVRSTARAMHGTLNAVMTLSPRNLNRNVHADPMHEGPANVKRGFLHQAAQLCFV